MPETDRPHFGIERLFLLALLVIITLAFALLIEPFFGAIVWSVVVAVLFQPVFHWFHGLMPRRENSAALLTLLLVVLLVIVPAIMLGSALIGEATNLYDRIRSGDIDLAQFIASIQGSLPTWLQTQLDESGFGDLESVRPRIEESVAAILEWVISQAINVGQGAFRFLLALGVMLYLTYFLLRDGVAVAQQIENVIPLAEQRRRILANKFFVVIRATIKGSFIVAILQGTIGGLIFWALDIQGALLWAVLMGVLSLIPAIGTGFVWVPVAGYLLATGSVWQGVVLIVSGFFIISMVDNLIRPVLVGRDTRMPDWVVLVSTFGGLQMFGFNGIVIGPLLAALFMAIWTIFAEMNREDQDPAAP